MDGHRVPSILPSLLLNPSRLLFEEADRQSTEETGKDQADLDALGQLLTLDCSVGSIVQV